MEIDDIIDILYDGSKEEIKKVIKDYEVSYNYDKKTKSFNVTSKKLLETSRGYKSHYEPNCIKYLGNKYNFNN